MLELIWLLERLTPDFKTIANFRKDNGTAIRKVCGQFVALCRKLNLLTETTVAIDGSKFKAVNNRDNNFTSTVVISAAKKFANAYNGFRTRALNLRHQGSIH